MTKAETIFQKELNQIHNPDIKQFVIGCFDKLCPDYFWTCPCSTSGKYHPQVSLGVGGLVRHTKLAVWWGIELLKALGTSPELKNIAPKQLQDEVVATLLLHDMIKNGEGLDVHGRPFNRGVTGTHGVTLAVLVEEFTDQLVPESRVRILDGIAGHMGIWTTNPVYRPYQPFANLIHLADYCASRKVDEIYHKLEQEKSNVIIEKTTDKKETPPCPGVREYHQGQATTTDYKSQ